MASFDPLTGARIGDMDDAPAGGLFLGEAVTELAPFTIPLCANAADRDARYAQWVANDPDKNKLTKGRRAFMLDDGRDWVYDGTRWTWLHAVGEIGYAQRSSLAGPVTTLGSWSPVSGLATSFTIPGPRKIKYTFGGQAVSNLAGTEVLVRVINTTNTHWKPWTAVVSYDNYGVGVGPVMRDTLTAGTYSVQVELMRLAGPGNAFLTADLSELIVEDMGAA